MTDSGSYGREILRRQFQAMQKNPPEGISVGLGDDEDMYKWEIFLIGPDNTLYEGGMFKAVMEFPKDFPDMPPSMTFTTKMWHPNIYPDGRVCISILHPPGDDPHNQQETADLRWRPVLGVESILVSVISMLSDPNDSSPANIDAAVQWRDANADFKKEVKRLVRRSQEEM
mmetsp:Transcript_18943/g.61367  ORF Transcript_18943/g.61367 Transcript_18943/m.61367 type:complete len:171 (-) Transcript_18943:81-593(-)